jgi:hypothetical protein
VVLTLLPGVVQQGPQGLQLAPGTSGTVIRNDIFAIPLGLSGSQTLTIGKERDGHIPVVIKAGAVRLARLPILALGCLCPRAVAAKRAALASTFTELARGDLRDVVFTNLVVTAAGPCAGDCDGSGKVTVDEILTLVNVALGNAQPPGCVSGVPTAAAVDIALIIEAVGNALGGCPGPPQAMPPRTGAEQRAYWRQRQRVDGRLSDRSPSMAP